MKNESLQTEHPLKEKRSDSLEIFVETLAELIEVPAAFIGLKNDKCINVRATYGVEGLNELSHDTKLWKHGSKSKEEFHIIEDLRNAHIPECKVCLTKVHGLNYYIAFPLGSNKEEAGFIAFLNKEKFLITPYQVKLLHLFRLIILDFLQLENQLLKKEEIADQILHKLAHDIRNPLTVITLHTELLKMEDGLNEDSIEICNKIQESSKRIETIVRDSYKVATTDITLGVDK